MERKSSLHQKLLPAVTVTALALASCRDIDSIQETRIVQPDTSAAEITDESVDSIHGIGVSNEILSDEHFLYVGKMHQYNTETRAIIENIEGKSKARIISPTDLVSREGYKQNMPWQSEEFKVISEAVSMLPGAYIEDNYRSPIEILLLKAPQSQENFGVIGGYANRAITLEIFETFSPDGSFEYPYYNQKDLLLGAIIHEWTHSFTEAHPGILLHWQKSTGWSQNMLGEWVNDRPENLNFLFGLSADTPNPIEDIAVSSAMMVVNPKALDEERIQFFLTNPYYSTWSVVQAYKDTYEINN